MAIKKKLLTIVVLLAVTLLCRLGYWQLSRAKEKQHLLTKWEQTRHEGALSLENTPDPTTNMESLRYRKVLIHAKLLNDFTILLDNKIKNGQAGYHVIVPAMLDSRRIVLINRGWIPLGASRQFLPIIEPVINEIIIEGYLDFAYRNSFIRDAIEINDVKWPLRMQWVDIALLNKIMNKNIYPMLVVLDEKSPYAFLPPLQHKEWLSPDKHRGYAIQWFSLAVTLIILYLLTVVKTTLYKKEEHEICHNYTSS